MKKIIFAVIIAASFSSCEREEGTPVDSDLTTPFISSSSLAVSSVNLDDTSAGSHVTKLANGRYRVTDTILASASSPLGANDIQGVSYRLYEPGSTQYFASGHLSYTGSQPTPSSREYLGILVFDVDRSDIGIYRIEVTAQNAQSDPGNALVLALTLGRNNTKPSTWGLVAPDTLFRPTSGFIKITLTLNVSDSDGYKDIQRVFLKRVLPTESDLISMHDDGETFYGDSRAGDGVFSINLQTDNTNTLGVRVFLFQAQDRGGAYSDTLLHTFTIVQGP